MRGVCLESSFPVKALGIVVEHEPTLPWAKGGDPSFPLSLARAHLGCCVQVWSPQSKREIGLVKKAQRRDTKVLKMITALRIEVETDYLALRWRILGGDDIIHVYPIYI